MSGNVTLLKIMKILAVCKFFPPFHYAGVELSILEILKVLRANGHQVKVLVFDNNGPGSGHFFLS